MRIATWNVNSLRARLPRVLPWLERAQPDVLCLQEIKCQDEQFPREPLAGLGWCIECFGQKTYNGVAFLSRLPVTDVVRGMPGDEPGKEARVIAGTVGGLRVVNAYVVNGQGGTEKYAYKLGWLARFADYMQQQRAAHGRLLVTGDFNVTFDDRDVHDPAAWHEQILCSTPERQALAKVLADAGLADAFRHFTPEGGHYTWWDFRTRGFQRGDGLRIDHVLLSPEALGTCTGVAIDVAARKGEKPSDHAPVVATLDCA